MPRPRSPFFRVAVSCLAVVTAGCGDVRQSLDQADASLRQFFGTAPPPPSPPPAQVVTAPPEPKARPAKPDPLVQAQGDWNAGRFDLAVKRLRPLAEAGNARAQYRLGLAYAQGRGVARDSVKALAWWHRAAVQGDADAQYQLGLAYLEGKDVEEDPGLASAWLARASAKEHGPATYRLARFYEARAVVSDDEADRRAGVVLLERAAEQGQPEAQMRIGEIYAAGRQGVTRDAAWAARWFGKAARQGVTEARVRLGDAFADGQGVPRDLVQAAAWYRLAAAGGSVGSEAAKSVEASLGAEQQAEVSRLMRRLAEQPAAGYTDVPTVLYVQTALSERGQDPGTADGVMGPATRKALAGWQKEQGLEPDGVIGPRVIAAFRGAEVPTLQAEAPE